MTIKIKKYSLKLICLGKEVKNSMFKTYFRYSCTFNGKQVFWHYPTDSLLTKDQVKLINENNYGGSIQQDLDKTKGILFSTINGLSLIYNSYPTPDQLKEHLEQDYSFKPMDYYVNEYLKQLQVRPSSKKIIGGHIKYFKTYYNGNLTKITLSQIISNKTIHQFGRWLILSNNMQGKKFGEVSKYNVQATVITFLNYIAKEKGIKILENTLKVRPSNEQFKITKSDFDRLLNYNKTTKHQTIQNYIYINSFIGLRVSEFVGIRKGNITINPSHIEIKFSEWKKNTTRTVVVVDSKAIQLIQNYMLIKSSILFNLNRSTFNVRLKALAKDIFKDEKIPLHNGEKNKEVEYLKADKISSHAIRRYAVQQNIIKYGVDTAKTFSGHYGYQTINKYANDFLEKEDVLKKLLEKEL